MKKLVLLLLLFSAFVYAQDSNKVWDLLLKNDRAGARAMFDKTLKKKMDTDMELLVLDALIDQQLGKLYFDETFLKKMTALKDSEHYLYPVWYQQFSVGNPNTEGYDELTYNKIDYVAGVDKFKDMPHVIYTKAIFDRHRLNFDAYNAGIKKLDVINKWQFCGVFENMNNSGLDTEYEPEFYAKNDKQFNANSNGIVNWYVPAIPQNEGYHFYLNESEYGNGIMYAQTFIDADADKDVVLNLGTSGPIKVYVNDTEIYYNDEAYRTDLNAYLIKFRLPKGTSRLLIKSSTTGGTDYFYAALSDTAGKKVSGLQYSDSYRPYVKSTAESLNATELNPAFEDFLAAKLKAKPNDIFHTLLLYDAYIANHKKEKAHDVIEKLAEKYPESSMLKVKLIDYYNLMDNEQGVEEINKTLLVNDPSYYYSIVKKFQDGNWVRESNIKELEEYRDKAKKLKSELYGILFDYLIASRNSDVDLTLQKIEELLSKSHKNEMFTVTFANMYSSLKNDKEKTISIMENLVKTRENVSAQNVLINYYNSVGRKEDAKQLVKNYINRYPYFNYVYDDIIEISNNENNYQASIDYADTALKNFPYSFRMMKEKGMGYNYLKKTKEAEDMFRQSLVYNAGNSSLRKTLYAITKVPDEIEQVSTKNLYDVIKQRRNSGMQNDYGVNILLDEYIINVLPEGSRKTKTVYLYEVTAENGVEELKEYSIGGNNLNVIKAEIVKPDGSIVPGERNYSTVVFTNLNVKDVIYLEYENTDNSYGRFFKDFTSTYYFNGVYPSQQTIFGIISPKEITFAQNILNGAIPAKTSKINGRNYISWEKKNIPTMPLYENYAPNYYDLANQVQVSSIKTWGDIANWYADLVKKNIKMDKVAEKTYTQIFPEGASKLSDEEKAYRIYKYIEDNITYSSLDFRQSGYVPQKPSKTINTKLGDCKDVSTLFVAMAEKAGLKANLVLVLTADNGTESLTLPSINFNHCIVKVNMAGKEHFIELTNRYMPFKAMPLSLYKAKALVVSFDKAENEKASIINIPNTNALKNVLSTTTVVNVDDNSKRVVSTHTIQGTTKSYYNELFSDATTEDVRKKQFEEDINSRLNKVISLESVKLVNNDKYADKIVFENTFTVSEKLQSIGSLKIMEIPYIDKVYTRDIIANEKRNYDIDYTAYENANEYNTEVVINIPQGKKFTEVPQGKELKFKGHTYTISYNLTGPNTLKVNRSVKLSWDNIKAADYPEYKKYVEDVLATEEEIIGFK